MLSLFVRRQGMQVLHLGSDVPTDDLVTIISNRQPKMLCLAVSTNAGRAGLNDVVAALDDAMPDMPIGVGGPWFTDHPAPDGTILLPNEYPAAAAEVLTRAV